MWNKCIVHEKWCFSYFRATGAIGHWFPSAKPWVSGFGVVKRCFPTVEHQVSGLWLLGTKFWALGATIFWSTQFSYNGVSQFVNHWIELKFWQLPHNMLFFSFNSVTLVWGSIVGDICYPWLLVLRDCIVLIFCCHKLW